MAWPPLSSLSSYGIGYTGVLPATLAWGTDELYSGVIVVAWKTSDMNEEIRIPNYQGLTAHQIIILDGKEIEITVIDDRALNFPNAGDPIILNDPSPSGGNATTINLTVLNNNYQTGRKQPGERNILCKFFSNQAL